MTTAVATTPVAFLELQARGAEDSSALVLPRNEPGRKFALAPGSALNSQGFNERDVPMESPPGTFRVVVVGDSVTFGSGVPVEETYPRVTEALLQAGATMDSELTKRRIEVLNLSVYSYDIEQVTATLKYRGWAYEPDLVVYAYYTNDHIPTEVLYLGEDQLPVYVGTSSALARSTTGRWLLDHFALVRRWEGAREVRRATGRLRNLRDGVSSSFFRQALRSMVDDCLQHETPLMVFGLTPHVLADEELCAELYPAPQRFCRAHQEHLDSARSLMEPMGLTFVSPLPVLRASPNRDFTLFSGDPHHPNARGHALFAQVLADAIRSHLEGEDHATTSPTPHTEF